MLREFLVVASAHLLAVMSPGPDMSVVGKIAARLGSREGIKAALGIAVGISCHISLSLLGLAAILRVNKGIFVTIQIAGALYLLWLGQKALFGGYKLKKFQGSAEDQPSTVRISSSFMQGLLANLTNPKATLFFLTLFTQVISPQTKTSIKILYGVEMVVATFAWFALVSYAFNVRAARKYITGHMWLVDMIFGVVLLGIAGAVLIEAAI